MRAGSLPPPGPAPPCSGLTGNAPLPPCPLPSRWRPPPGRGRSRDLPDLRGKGRPAGPGRLGWPVGAPPSASRPRFPDFEARKSHGGYLANVGLFAPLEKPFQVKARAFKTVFPCESLFCFTGVAILSFHGIFVGLCRGPCRFWCFGRE